MFKDSLYDTEIDNRNNQQQINRIYFLKAFEKTYEHWWLVIKQNVEVISNY